MSKRSQRMVSGAEIERFLRLVLASQHVSDLFAVVQKEPNWLSPAVFDHVEKHIEAVEAVGPLPATRQRIGLLRRIVDAATRVAAIHSFVDLVRFAQADAIVASEAFASLLSGINGTSSRRPYRKFLALLKQWPGRLAQVHKVKRFFSHPETMKTAVSGFKFSGNIHFDRVRLAAQCAPQALEESTLYYLSSLIHADVEFGDGTKARNLAPDLECIEIVAFNVRRYSSAKPGQQVALRAMNAAMASAWYVTGIPAEYYFALIEAVRSGRKDFNSALAEAQKVALDGYEKEVNSIERTKNYIVPARSFQLTTCSAAFAVLAASGIGTSEQTEASLNVFHELIKGAWWNELTQHQRATTIFRYGQFVLMQFGRVRDQQGELKLARSLIVDTVGFLLSGEHPGLERDLRLMAARIAVELGRWEPEIGGIAIGEFQRGLEVPWARFDSEVRGLGLCDFAGAIRRFGPQALEPQVQELYQASLVFLDKEKFPHSRITALANYAVFMNERSAGNDSHNQEIALQLIDEAIDIVRSVEDEEAEANRGDESVGRKSAAEPHVKVVRASPWLTRGNIIRARTFGGAPSAHSSMLSSIDALPKNLSARGVASIVSYHEGLRALGDSGNEALRGQFHLNIGYAYLEEFHLENRAILALGCYQRALPLLAESPHDYALAKIAECEALLLVDPHGDEPGQTILDEVATLESFGDLQRASRGLLVYVKSLLSTKKTAQIAKAAKIVEKAVDLARLTGEIDLIVHTLQIQANVLILWSKTGRGETPAKHRRLALDALKEALARLSSLLKEDIPLSSAIHLEGQRARLAADLLWIGSTLGDIASSEWAELLKLSGFPGVVVKSQESSLVSGDAIRNALHTEDLLWSRGSQVETEQHLAIEVERLESAIDEIQVSREAALLFSQDVRNEGEVVESLNESTVLSGVDNRLIIQFVISEWGGLAILGSTTVPIPVDRSKVEEWLYGSTRESGWLGAYKKRASGGNWREMCETLARAISAHVWQPLELAGVEFEGKDVLVVPGQLAGLPLHTASLQKGPLIELVSGFSYIPTAQGRVCPPPQKFERGLLVLSDPVVPKETALSGVSAEIVELSQVFLGFGMKANVLAHSWGRTGRSLFEERGHPLPDTVNDGGIPSSEKVLDELSNADLFVYAGHGHGVGSYGGYLVLTDGEGRPSVFSLMRALARRPFDQHPGIVLSACETAWEMSGPASGLTSVASTFLRLGASFVVGSLWLIGDASAAHFSVGFVNEILGGLPPERAYARVLRSMVQAGYDVSRWGSYCIWLGQIVVNVHLAEQPPEEH